MDLIQKRVIAAIEEILHHAGHAGQVFRRGEDIAIRFQQILWRGFRSMQPRDGDIAFPHGAFKRCLRHLPRAIRHGMVNDQKCLHADLA